MTFKAFPVFRSDLKNTKREGCHMFQLYSEFLLNIINHHNQQHDPSFPFQLCLNTPHIIWFYIFRILAATLFYNSFGQQLVGYSGKWWVSETQFVSNILQRHQCPTQTTPYSFTYLWNLKWPRSKKTSFKQECVWTQHQKSLSQSNSQQLTKIPR